jgi:hypothetical protein
VASRWEEYKAKNGVTPLDALNPQTRHTSEMVSNARMDICKTCPRLVPIVHQCRECGCFMAVKTQLESAKCPLGRW